MPKQPDDLTRAGDEKQRTKEGLTTPVEEHPILGPEPMLDLCCCVPVERGVVKALPYCDTRAVTDQDPAP